MAVEELNLDEVRSLDSLEEHRRALASEIKTIEDQQGLVPMDGPLAAQVKKYYETVDEVDRRLTEFKARRARLEKLDQSTASQERTEDVFGGRTMAVKRDRDNIWNIRSLTDPEILNDNAKFAIEELRPVGIDRAEAQEHVTGLLDERGLVARHILSVQAPAYISAFQKTLKGLPLTSVEANAFASARALSLTGASGGFAVPVDLDPTIIPTSNGTVNPIRQISRVIQITGDTWNGVSSGAITASYAAEATETTDNSPTLAAPVISTEKAQAFIPFSIEIGMDWPSLRTEIGTLLADAKDVLEATKFTVGTGTNEPFGVITGATTTVNAASPQTFTLANLYSLYGALPPRFRPRSTFLGNLAILSLIRQFDAVGSSAQIWVDTLQDGIASRLLGRPAYEASDMASTTVTAAKFLLLGDFSRYVIVDRIGLEIELIPHLFGSNQRPTGQRGLYAYWRNGAKVVDANAFRLLLGVA